MSPPQQMKSLVLPDMGQMPGVTSGSKMSPEHNGLAPSSPYPTKVPGKTKASKLLDMNEI